MTAAIVEFLFGDQPFRIVDQGGENWFVGRDICAALEIKNESDALGKLDDDERRDGVAIADKWGRQQTVVLISEPGLWRLVFASRKAAAERFKRWLAHDVLPALRKHGRYEMARAERQAAGAVAKNSNRVRYAKMALVAVAMRLEDLGIDASAINMAAVVKFGRQLASL